MTNDEIDALPRDAVTDLMRKLGLPVVVSFFATIHHRSESRPDGYTSEDMDKIDEQLEDADLARDRQALKDHFNKA